MSAWEFGLTAALEATMWPVERSAGWALWRKVLRVLEGMVVT
jgi:hypothetical protein